MNDMTLQSYEKMSDAEVSEFVDRTATEIATIRGQIEMAKASVAGGGEYADPIWYAKAKQALRYKGLHHQQAMREQARRRKNGKQAPRENENAIFRQVAKRLLTHETYMMIATEAEEEARS